MKLSTRNVIKGKVAKIQEGHLVAGAGQRWTSVEETPSHHLSPDVEAATATGNEVGDETKVLQSEPGGS